MCFDVSDAFDRFDVCDGFDLLVRKAFSMSCRSSTLDFPNSHIPNILQRDQASLDSDRRDYELAVRSQAERCDAAGAARLMSAATRSAMMQSVMIREMVRSCTCWVW